MNATCLIVDLSNHVHSDWHATADAQVTMRRLEAIYEKLETWSVLIACDPGGKTFRHELSETYKQTRKPKDEGLTDRLLEVVELCELNEWDVVKVPGFEADDVIATGVKIAKKHGFKCVISSSDKDLRQLLSPGNVSIIRKVQYVEDHREYDWWTAKRLKAETGLRPSQWADYLALVGDATDNVKGCPQIGPKTAVKLLTAASTIEEAFRDPWSLPITEKQRDQLIKWKPLAEITKKLVELRDDLPMEWVP